MKVRRIVIFTGIVLMFFSCQEKKLEPINMSTGKPEPVKFVEATSTPGGAIISFVVPVDNNIMSIKAVYTLTNGKQRESITSCYGNSVIIEGYNDTDEHEALLYTVSLALELSEPVPVRFTPHESPLRKAAKSASITSDFGGAYFAWNNEDRILLTVEMFAADNNGKLTTARIINSTLASAYYSLRGYEPEPRKFALILADNWDNVSDTIYPPGGIITPWSETKLDKAYWSIYRYDGAYLPGDVSFTNWEGRDEFMFDDDVLSFGHSITGALPYTITFDLGKHAVLSRAVFFQRFHNGGYFRWGNPKHIIVYGCSEPPTTGNWDEWTELIDFTIIKPSGTDNNFTFNSEEDTQAAENGHEAAFPISTNTYRYLRFRFMSSWEDRPYVHPAEITLYGEYAE